MPSYSQPVPQELIDAIIAMLIESMIGCGERPSLMETLKACTLASHLFVDACHKEMFRVVCLESSKVRGMSGVATTKNIDSIKRFNEIVRGRPTIAARVRDLTYRLTYDWEREEEAVYALSRMSMVTKFTVEMEMQPRKTRMHMLDFSSLQFLREGGELARAVLDIACSEGIRSLTFRNLDLPAGTLSKAINLEELELHNHCHSAFATDGSILEVPLARPRLKTLRTTSTHIIEEILTTLKTGTEFRPESKTMFSDIEVLQIPVPPMRPQSIFSWTGCLRDLHLEDRHYSSGALWGPLRGLNPSSFSTLTKLSYSMHQDLDNDPDMTRPFGLLLANKGTLRKLIALEELVVSVTLDGRTDDVDSRAYGDQWGRLDHFLAPAGSEVCALPTLKRVEVVFTITNEEDNPIPFSVTRETKARIALKQFQGLKALNNAGKIDLEIRVGSWKA